MDLYSAEVLADRFASFYIRAGLITTSTELNRFHKWLCDEALPEAKWEEDIPLINFLTATIDYIEAVHAERG